jgi:hypothetical protein
VLNETLFFQGDRSAQITTQAQEVHEEEGAQADQNLESVVPLPDS